MPSFDCPCAESPSNIHNLYHKKFNFLFILSHQVQVFHYHFIETKSYYSVNIFHMFCAILFYVIYNNKLKGNIGLS